MFVSSKQVARERDDCQLLVQRDGSELLQVGDLVEGEVEQLELGEWSEVSYLHQLVVGYYQFSEVVQVVEVLRAGQAVAAHVQKLEGAAVLNALQRLQLVEGQVHDLESFLETLGHLDHHIFCQVEPPHGFLLTIALFELDLEGAQALFSQINIHEARGTLLGLVARLRALSLRKLLAGVVHHEALFERVLRGGARALLNFDLVADPHDIPILPRSGVHTWSVRRLLLFFNEWLQGH